MSFFVRVAVNAIALWLATLLLGDHFRIDGGGSALNRVIVLLGVALLYSLVNAIVKPLVQIISLPLYILTLGLFTLIVNALMLLLTEWITQNLSWGIRIDGGFWWAVWAALIISVLNFLISALIPSKRVKA